MVVIEERFKVGDRVAVLGALHRQGAIVYRFEGRTRVVYGVRWASGGYDLIDDQGLVFTDPDRAEIDRLTRRGWPEIERPNRGGCEL